MEMNTIERLKLSLLRGSIDGKYTVKELSSRLHLSERRIKQLKRSFRKHGDSAVLHGNKGRKPSNATAAALREHICAIKSRPLYMDMNFSHFHEYLASDFGIAIGYGALRSALLSGGCASRKSHRRARKKQHRHRERRSCPGELLQADATPFDWLGIGERFALHGFIDDATSSITSLYMSRNECLQGYYEALRRTIERHGIPMEIYTDRGGVFSVNEKSADSKDLGGNDLRKTQFGRALDELGINSIFANSPQAKGRVERMWQTLQDRLSIFLRKNGAATIEQANEMLPGFIEEHNAKFAVEPGSKDSRFVPIARKAVLDTLLAVKHERMTDRCGAFSFMSLKFQVEADECMANKKITFMFSDKIGLKAQIGKKLYPVRQLSFISSKKSPLPNVLKDLLSKCCLANAHSQNYREIK
jgi:transposase